jgi:hypothetical protein
MPRHGIVGHAVQPGQRGQHRTQRVGRRVQPEPVHRLADRRARLPQRGHHDQRGQLAKVLARARHALVEPLVAGALLGQVTGVRHRDQAVGHRPAVQALLQRLPHRVLDGPEERGRHGAGLRLDPEFHPRAVRGRLQPQPDRGQERVGCLPHPLDRGTATCQPLDADRGRLAEADVKAEVRCQRGPDDFLLHLAVQRDGDLPADVVLPDVDQRVLLGQLGQRGAQRTELARIARHDHRLQRRRGEPVPRSSTPRHADRVADPDLGQAPQLADLAHRDRVLPHVRAAVKDAERGHLLLPAVAEPHPVPGPHPAGEHADVGDLLACRPPLDLEHPPRGRAAGVPPGRRQQPGDAAHQRAHARPGQRRPEEHRVHPAPPDLRRELAAQPPLRKAPGQVGSENGVVLLGQHLG